MHRRIAERSLAVAVVAVGSLAACGRGDGRELQPATAPMPPPPTPPSTLFLADLPAPPIAPPPSPPPSPLPSVSASPGGDIVFDRLWSPEPAVAEVIGVGATLGDAVTVDGGPADVVTFDVGADGTFDARIAIEDEGAHTVCVGATCGRVYTLAADAEPPEGNGRSAPSAGP